MYVCLKECTYAIAMYVCMFMWLQDMHLFEFIPMHICMDVCLFKFRLMDVNINYPFNVCIYVYIPICVRLPCLCMCVFLYVHIHMN